MMGTDEQKAQKLFDVLANHSAPIPRFTLDNQDRTQDSAAAAIESLRDKCKWGWNEYIELAQNIMWLAHFAIDRNRLFASTATSPENKLPKASKCAAWLKEKNIALSERTIQRCLVLYNCASEKPTFQRKLTSSASLGRVVDYITHEVLESCKELFDRASRAARPPAAGSLRHTVADVSEIGHVERAVNGCMPPAKLPRITTANNASIRTAASDAAILFELDRLLAEGIADLPSPTGVEVSGAVCPVVTAHAPAAGAARLSASQANAGGRVVDASTSQANTQIPSGTAEEATPMHGNDGQVQRCLPVPHSAISVPPIDSAGGNSAVYTALEELFSLGEQQENQGPVLVRENKGLFVPRHHELKPLKSCLKNTG